MTCSPLGNSMSNSVAHIQKETHLRKYSNSNGKDHIWWDQFCSHSQNTKHTSLIQPCSSGGYISLQYVATYAKKTINSKCLQWNDISQSYREVHIYTPRKEIKMDKNFGPTNDGMTRQKWISFYFSANQNCCQELMLLKSLFSKANYAGP